jgi:hypothetical protein
MTWWDNAGFSHRKRGRRISCPHFALTKLKEYSLASRLRGSLENPAPKERHNLAHGVRRCEKIGRGYCSGAL